MKKKPDKSAVAASRAKGTRATVRYGMSRRELDDATKDAFIAAIRQTGAFYLSCESIGFSPGKIKEAQKLDAEFKEAIEFARQCWVDENLERPAFDRATKGVLRPLLGGKFKDEVVTHETVYSDGLLGLLLKGYRPEYRESHKTEVNVQQNQSQQHGVMVIPAGHVNSDQWETNFSQMCAPGNEKLIDAPPQPSLDPSAAERRNTLEPVDAPQKES